MGLRRDLRRILPSVKPERFELKAVIEKAINKAETTCCDKFGFVHREYIKGITVGLCYFADSL